MICVGPKRLFEKSGNERFDQCRATSEDATMTLSLLKSIMPIFMWIPFQAAMETFQTASKVSTTTSNFMIGVTAAASAGVYLNRGYIDPGLAMPVMLGVLMGSMLGARVLTGARVKVLRIVFGVVILALGVEMIYKGLTGR